MFTKYCLSCKNSTEEKKEEEEEKNWNAEPSSKPPLWWARDEIFKYAGEKSPLVWCVMASPFRKIPQLWQV